MKTAIIYYSKHGTTEHVAYLIGESLNHKVDYISLRESPKVDIRTYDRIILGTSIYAGTSSRIVTQFCNKNRLLLEQKVIGLFICRMNKEQETKEMEKAFPEYLQKLASNKLNTRQE
ncbi:flavodoxin domain-containing protein [Parabacteroides pacaensis]|uniref:flavodoxin domain-containing protein n=1 Tax=Parabacteroides pacaensis TaxID=2086575 RepID=UPI000D0E416E|nr:flavodoxin domain-containing protein [Parabacteroides pacaensis]